MAKETGLQHDWFLPSAKGYRPLTGADGQELECCRACGVVKPRDPERAQAASCRGQVKVTLRAGAESPSA